MVMTEDDKINHRKSTNCHICDEPFKVIDGKLEKRIRDHCHITGRYRGAAHEVCNLNFKFSTVGFNKSIKIPVVIHNLRGYDSHLIIKHFHDQSHRISCIPNNMEKYMSLTIDNLAFIDSVQFMVASLEELVSNLKKGGIENFIHTGKYYQGEQLTLMTQKGVYPYGYMNSWERFNETELPPKEAFYNDLTNEQLADEDYEHAKKVWRAFGCQTMGDYHDIYLKSDVLLLADVFETFRKTSLQYYKLDPANYMTAPGMAWDAMLRLTKVELELLTDINMYQFVESAIRGGICVISKRFAKANNPYMTTYDSNLPTTYIQYLDANNLYGWAMSQVMPTSGFKWIDDSLLLAFTEKFIMDIPDDCEDGCFLEVDIDYPHEIHNLHNDYPLLPEQKLITHNMLSKKQISIMQAHDISDDKVSKLIPNLSSKRNYIIHYRY